MPDTLNQAFDLHGDKTLIPCDCGHDKPEEIQDPALPYPYSLAFIIQCPVCKRETLPYRDKVGAYRQWNQPGRFIQVNGNDWRRGKIFVENRPKELIDSQRARSNLEERLRKLEYWKFRTPELPEVREFTLRVCRHI